MMQQTHTGLSTNHVTGVLTCSREAPAATLQQWWRRERQRKQPL